MREILYFEGVSLLILSHLYRKLFSEKFKKIKFSLSQNLSTNPLSEDHIFLIITNKKIPQAYPQTNDPGVLIHKTFGSTEQCGRISLHSSTS